MFRLRLWFILSLVMLVWMVSAVSAQSGAPLTLVRSENSITLIVVGNQPVNLDGLTFETTIQTPQGERTNTRRLDSFPGFRGIPFEQTPAPACFHIELSGNDEPIDTRCGVAMTFQQSLAPSDGFWKDGLGNAVTIRILNAQGGVVTFCPVTVGCVFTYNQSMTAIPSTLTTPNVIATPPPALTCDDLLNTTMVAIPETTFAMGLSFDDRTANGDEYRIDPVSVNAFCIDTHEVVNAAYSYCVSQGACTPPASMDAEGYPNYYRQQPTFPVVNVRWDQAQAFCTYRGGRLPTEAEWELVARHDPATGEMRAYPWGNDAPSGDPISPRDDRANFNSNQIAAGGRYPDGASAYGVHDLSGNVAEWVYDGYAPYEEAQTENPIGDENAVTRVVRGGSYVNDADALRGAARAAQSPASYTNDVGFRCMIPPTR